MSTMTDVTTTARIFDTDEIDLLGEYPPVEIPASSFREDMVLLDDLGTPAGRLDHKIGRATNGAATWLVEDLDRGGWVETRFAVNKRFTVAGR